MKGLDCLGLRYDIKAFSLCQQKLVVRKGSSLPPNLLAAFCADFAMAQILPCCFVKSTTSLSASANLEDLSVIASAL